MKLISSLILFLTLCCHAARSPEAVPNEHIVMLSKGVERDVYDSVLDQVRTLLGDNDELGHTYFFGNFRGFSIKAPKAVMNLVKLVPGVETVEPNYYMYGDQYGSRMTQLDTGYGLDRISHRSNFAKGNVQRSTTEFVYFLPDGKGTTVYVLDSGVYLQHNDFQGRARFGADYAPANVLGNPNFRFGGDPNGHGTCSASCAAGYKYGVAKFANIIDVRILNDNGTGHVASSVAGIQFAVQDALSRGTQTTSILNMSFGGPADPHSIVTSSAVQEAINAGLFCAVAAGNDAINAEAVTPANTEAACTVGALDAFDVPTHFSNYGQLIDIWAPGEHIRCAGTADPNAMIFNSGTSFSAPYTAGVGLYLKSLGSFYAGMSPRSLCGYLQKFGTHFQINFRPNNVPPGPNVILNDLQGRQ